jgi:hypothetical protein
MNPRHAAAPASAAAQDRGRKSEQLAGGSTTFISQSHYPRQALPGRAPHRPGPHTVDGQISAIWRAYGMGRLTWDDAARRDAALRRQRGRVT